MHFNRLSFLSRDMKDFSASALTNMSVKGVFLLLIAPITCILASTKHLPRLADWVFSSLQKEAFQYAWQKLEKDLECPEVDFQKFFREYPRTSVFLIDVVTAYTEKSSDNKLKLRSNLIQEDKDKIKEIFDSVKSLSNMPRNTDLKKFEKSILPAGIMLELFCSRSLVYENLTEGADALNKLTSWLDKAKQVMNKST